MLLSPDQKIESPLAVNAIHLWIDLYAPISLVFNYLTGAKELSTWWASRCETDRQLGGKLHFIWDGDVIRTGDAIFQTYDAPDRITVEWTHGDGQPIGIDGGDKRGLMFTPRTHYQLTVMEDGRTRLHMVDHGINASPDFAALHHATVTGWQECLTRLKRVVETRHSQNLAQDMRRKQKKDVAGKVQAEFGG